jgi:hypothetical protein
VSFLFIDNWGLSVALLHLKRALGWGFGFGAFMGHEGGLGWTEGCVCAYGVGVGYY